MNKIIECVPNFSEGRDLQKIDQIISPFRGKQGVKLLTTVMTKTTTVWW